MTPNCPKCANITFDMKEIKINNANYRHHAIYCRSCGCIVHIEEMMSIMFMLQKIAEKLGVSFNR